VKVTVEITESICARANIAEKLGVSAAALTFRSVTRSTLPLLWGKDWVTFLFRYIP
jgi:hypothetical protein